MIPLVTLEQFKAISCNRCGACCEGMSLSGDPAAKLVALQETALSSLANAEQITELRTIVGMLECIGEFHEGTPKWRCRNFRRDAERLGVCGIYDQRPRMCRDFPYGRPQEIEGCAWNVELVKTEETDV